MRYEKAIDIQKIFEDVVKKLGLMHIKLDEVVCVRSYGSKSRGTIARCHALGKAMQLGMSLNTAFYVIEVISKQFDKLSPQDQVKTIIHELMHIPKSFGGGFKHHNIVNEKNVDRVYTHYCKLKQQETGEKRKWF